MRLSSACWMDRQTASLTTGNDLLPKPLDIEPPFFLRAKVTSVHSNLSYTDNNSHCASW